MYTHFLCHGSSWLIFIDLTYLIDLLAEYEGRRRELIVAATFYIVGAVIQTAAPSFIILVVGRLVYGLGIGMVGIIKTGVI